MLITFRVLLDLSSMGESEMEVACHIAKNLCPIKNGYTAIMFPHSRINAAKWQDLLNLLANAGLRVRVGIRVPNTNITKQEEAELNTFAKNRTLGGFESWPEDFLWSLY